MRTLLKWLVGIFAAIIVLIMIAIICIVLFINPNNFKTQLSKKVFDATGRQLNIGELSWTVYPWLGIKANNISLSNPAGFDKQLFAQANQAEIAAKLESLFEGRLELGYLTIDGLNLNLIKKANGVTNWQDLVDKTKSTSDSSDPDPQTSLQSGKHKLIVSISGVKLSNAQLYWVDQQDNKIIDLKNIQFNVDKIGLDQSMPVSLSFDVNNNKPQFMGNIKLKSDILFNRDQQLIMLNGTQLNVSELDNQFQSGQLDIDLNTDASVDLAKDAINIPKISGSIANMKFNGQFQTISFKNLKQVNGAIEIPSFDLQQFLNAIGKPASGALTSVNNVSSRFQLQTSSSSVALNQLQATVDNSHINGNLSIVNFASPSYQFKLNVDSLDLSDKTSPQVTSSNNVSSAKTVKPSKDSLLPVATLRKLNANGQLSINQLVLTKLSISHFYTQLNANNGSIQLNPLKGNIYQGQMTNNISINVKNNSPQFKIISSFTGIQMGALLDELTDITRIKISGSGNLSANITTSGNNTNDIKRTLSGNSSFSVNNGVLYGIDIPYYSDVADSLIKKQLPTATNTHQTNFGNLTGTLNINNGLVSNNDLLVSAPDLSVKGKGTADLVSEQLNYAMQMQRMVNGAAQGPEIPLLIKGTFSHPSIQPDVSEILKNQLQKQLEKKLSDKLQKEISDNPNAQQIEKSLDNSNVGQQLQKGLKSLFGQ